MENLWQVPLSFSVAYKCRRIPSYDLTSLSSKVYLCSMSMRKYQSITETEGELGMFIIVKLHDGPKSQVKKPVPFRKPLKNHFSLLLSNIVNHISKFKLIRELFFVLVNNATVTPNRSATFKGRFVVLIPRFLTIVQWSNDHSVRLAALST